MLYKTNIVSVLLLFTSLCNAAEHNYTACVKGLIAIKNIDDFKIALTKEYTDADNKKKFKLCFNHIIKRELTDNKYLFNSLNEQRIYHQNRIDGFAAFYLPPQSKYFSSRAQGDIMPHIAEHNQIRTEYETFLNLRNTLNTELNSLQDERSLLKTMEQCALEVFKNN